MAEATVSIRPAAEITIRTRAVTSAGFEKCAEYIFLARFQLGESSPFKSGSHSLVGLLALVCGKRGRRGRKKDAGNVCVQRCSSDCGFLRQSQDKKEGKGGGGGGRQSIYIPELCTDILQCRGRPLQVSCSSEKTSLLLKSKTNTCASLRNEQPFP